MAISPDNCRFHITMPKELRKELQQQADRKDRTLSNYIVYILDLFMRQKNKANTHHDQS